MPLIPKFTPSVDLSGDGKFYLTDTTGDYDPTTNVGGYGTINPLRNALVLLSYAEDIFVASTPVVFSANAYNEEVVAKFTFDLDKSKDRILRFINYAVLIETGGEGVGDIYYNLASDEIRQTTGGGYDVLAITDLEGDVTIPQEELHIYLANYLQDILKNKVQRDLYYFKSNVDECDDDDIAKLEKQVRELNEIYTGAELNLLGEKYDRVRKAITATTIYINENVDLS